MQRGRRMCSQPRTGTAITLVPPVSACCFPPVPTWLMPKCRCITWTLTLGPRFADSSPSLNSLAIRRAGLLLTGRPSGWIIEMVEISSPSLYRAWSHSLRRRHRHLLVKSPWRASARTQTAPTGLSRQSEQMAPSTRHHAPIHCCVTHTLSHHPNLLRDGAGVMDGRPGLAHSLVTGGHQKPSWNENHLSFSQ